MSAQDKAVTEPAKATTTVAAHARPAMKYYRIRMGQKRNQSDSDSLPVGTGLAHPRLLKLGQECIVNETEKCILDCAVQPTHETRIVGRQHIFTQGQPIKLYDYHLLGEATKAEYDEGLSSSNNIARGELAEMQRMADMQAKINGDQ